jgi:hypothetical protein
MTLSTTSPGDEREALEELYRALSVVGVVGQIDGHDVIRRLSVLDVVRARQMRSSSTVQQVGADALDAARYRWLRSYPNNVNAAVYGPTGGLLRRDDYLDAAIDAAIASSPKSEQGNQQ